MWRATSTAKERCAGVEGEARSHGERQRSRESCRHGQPSGVADPVIAAFRAAKEKPAGSQIDFRLTASLTFENRQVNATPWS